MEKALFCNNLIKKITAALMIVMLLIPYCFAQVTFGDNKSDLKNAQNQQNDIQNKKKETLIPRLQSLKLRLRRHRQSLSRLRLIRKASMGL